MKKKILLTRPISASLRWAELLARHTIDCVVEPLLHITPTHMPRPDGSFQAVIVTSANAPEALIGQKEKISDLLVLPCFCIGTATGSAAQILGFTTIQCGIADSATLASLIIGTLTDKTRPLLHIAGDIVDTKAQDILSKAGFTVVTWPVYSANAVTGLTGHLQDLLAKGSISVIPVFSPRSAHILVGLIEKNRLTSACHHITAVGLSQAVADVLQKLPWQRLRVAMLPSEESVLTCLLTESAMPTAEPVTPPVTPTPAPPRKKRGFVLGLLTILVLSGAGAATLAQGPWFNAISSNKTIVPVTQNIDALEDRVRMLESRLDAQQNAPVAATDEAGLADTVKTLQNQVVQLQNNHGDAQQQAQKWVASAFAFWDLRNAANEGHPFGTQLAALHDATENDTDISAQTAVLFAYTSGVSTWAQLHDELAAHEPAIDTTTDPDAPQTLAVRVKKILDHLVSIHPLHQASYTTLEGALAAGNGPDALTAFNGLPDNAKQSLSDFQAKLQARLAVDNALHTLAQHFSATPAKADAAKSDAP